MTEAQKIRTVLAMSGETKLSSETVAAYLNLAKETILNRAYPYRDRDMALPSKYEFVQVRIAVYLINKRGAEGETQHVEVGTQRNYTSADIPDDLLSEVVPAVGFPR